MGGLTAMAVAQGMSAKVSHILRDTRCTDPKLSIGVFIRFKLSSSRCQPVHAFFTNNFVATRLPVTILTAKTFSVEISLHSSRRRNHVHVLLPTALQARKFDEGMIFAVESPLTQVPFTAIQIDVPVLLQYLRGTSDESLMSSRLTNTVPYGTLGVDDTPGSVMEVVAVVVLLTAGKLLV